MKLRTIRHWALVSEMMGLEGIITVDFIVMIVNLQALGLPLVYTPLPILCSATLSLLLIPSLGYFNVHFAKTHKLKALTLCTINCLQMSGAALVILANYIKLQVPIITPGINHTTAFPGSDINMSNLNLVDSFDGNSYRSVVADEKGDGSSSESFNLPSGLAFVGYIMVDCGYDTGSCFVKTFALASTAPKHYSSIIVKAIIVSSMGGIYTTLLGSVGVAELLAKDTDLDINALTPIVLMTACIIINIPTMITTLLSGLCCSDADDDGTDDNSYAAVGEKDEDDDDRSNAIDEEKEEKQRLISESMASNSTGVDVGGNAWQLSVGSVATDGSSFRQEDTGETMRSRRQRRLSISRGVVEKVWQLSQSGAHSLMEHTLTQSYRKQRTGVKDGSVEIKEVVGQNQGCMAKARSFWKTNQTRVFICCAYFFGVGAVFVFNVYSVNFVAVSIFEGDPKAPRNSIEYENYLKGLKAGSTGLLVFYSSFVVGTTLQAFLLDKIGWWMELSIVFIAYIACNITCAVTKIEGVYYVSSFLNGFYRAVIFTVPYLLVCKANSKDPHNPNVNANDSNSWDIALVSTMLPLVMALFSSIMGPLLEGSNDASSPMFINAGSSAIGLFFFSLLRKY